MASNQSKSMMMDHGHTVQPPTEVDSSQIVSAFWRENAPDDDGCLFLLAASSLRAHNISRVKLQTKAIPLAGQDA